MTTQPAAPVILISGEAWQELARAGRLDHRLRAHDRGARQAGVIRHENVEAFAGVGVHRGEDRWIFLDTEEVLVNRNLRRVLRISFCEPVAIEPAPGLCVDSFMFPETGVGDVADL